MKPSLSSPNDRSYGPKGIHNMMILTRTGVPLVYRDYRSLDIADSNLAAGFVSAIDTFAQDALNSRGGIKRFEVDGLECVVEKTPYLLGMLAMDSDLKSKQKTQYVEKMANVMTYLWNQYHEVIDTGACIDHEANSYVDGQMGFNHEAVVDHEYELAANRRAKQARQSEEERINSILYQMETIGNREKEKAAAESDRLNKINGNYSRQMLAEFRREVLSQMGLLQT